VVFEPYFLVLVVTGVPARIFSWAFSSLAHNFELKQLHAGLTNGVQNLEPFCAMGDFARDGFLSSFEMT
jgi:hypothetical protein